MSPPAMTTPYSLPTAAIPLVEGNNILDQEVVGQRQGDEGVFGVPPIAAMSLTLAASAFQPRSLQLMPSAREVDAGDERVGRGEVGGSGALPEGGVVTDADEQVRAGAQDRCCLLLRAQALP